MENSAFTPQTASSTDGPLLLPFNGNRPRVHRTAWIAPNATLIGDVEIGAHSSVYYGCVLRGDVNSIRIGERTNIQDNSVLHVDSDAPCTLGDDVTVGHMALVHGSTVGNGARGDEIYAPLPQHDPRGEPDRRGCRRVGGARNPCAIACCGRACES